MGGAHTVKRQPARDRTSRLSSAREAASKTTLLSKVAVKTSYNIGGKKVIATEVFDTFWKYAAERQAIYEKRVRGEDAPWTDDSALQTNKFCNTFRVADATCQYIIRWIIRSGSQAPAELVFRVLLFDTFTRIETWEYLLRNIGAPTWATYDHDTYARVLHQAKKDGMILYTGSFQKPAPYHGHEFAFMNHLHALELLMKADLPGRLVAATHMADVFDWLCTFKGMGDFTAYQLLLNLSYTGLGKFEDADSFVVLGIGAHAGIGRCFNGELSPDTKVAIVRWMQRTQREHFARLGLSCTLGPPGSKYHEMSVSDVEHTLCEVDKYARSGSRRRFHPSEGPTPELIVPLFPSDDHEERWTISRIAGQRKYRHVLQYQVYWEGFDEPTWEPAEMVQEDAPLAVEEFLNGL